jgi:hypothetical protein
MTEREKIISDLSPYFKVKELVCEHTFAKYGERSWDFLDTDYLKVLLLLRREIFRRPMFCNFGSYHQRGLRCNRCQLVRSKEGVYLSAHVLGKAGDFTIQDLTSNAARMLVRNNANRFPVPVRIERNVNWLHIDVRPDGSKPEAKVIEFNG